MAKKKYFSSVTTLCFCLVIWAGQIFGFFDLPEGMIYDFLVQVTPAQQHATEDIIILKVDDALFSEGDAVWLHLLTSLKAMQPKAIVFPLLPPHGSETFYAAAEKSDNVFFARQLTQEKKKIQLDPLPAQALGRDLQIGLLAMPPTSYGVHRQYEAGYITSEGPLPSIVSSLSAWINNHPQNLENTEPFLINFFRSSPALPSLSFARLLAGEITPDLLHNRIVLISLSFPLHSHGFQTPINLGEESMSLIEYTGYALETFLEGKEPIPAGPWLTLTLLCLTGLCTFFAFQYLSTLYHLLYTVTILAALLLCSWSAVRFFQFWSPVAALLLLQMALFLVIPLVRLKEREQFTQNILLEHSAALRKNFFPERLTGTDEYWSHVINMINQTLHLHRSIFLETVEGDHRVREVIALHCSIEEIAERRRDYQRTPYLTALAEGVPISVSGYLAAGPDDEEQFLVPLKTADQVLGFWAFGVCSLDKTERKILLETVQMFAGKISMALLEQKEFLQLDRLQHRGMGRFFGSQAVDAVSTQLDQMILLTKRRMQALEILINALSTATVLYDSFGRLIQINTRMSELLRDLEGVNGGNCSSLDLGVCLTGKSMEEIRRLLSQVVIEKKNIRLPAKLGSDAGTFELIIHPVSLEVEATKSNTSNASSFQIRGILFELLDISNLQDAWHLQEELFEQTNFHLHQDLEQMLAAEKVLKQDNLETSRKSEALSLLHRSREDMQTFVEDIDSFVTDSLLTEHPDIFPVNPEILLRETGRALKQETEQHRVTWSINAEEHVELVYAGPDMLKELLTALVKVLLDDAAPDTILSADFFLHEHAVLCTLSNTGYGMPDATFQQYLFDQEAARSEAFTKIHQTLPELERWGACLCGTSTIGHGIRFELMLRRFH
ncbi:MAG: CHASE2 domain-containing protein [Candidatus Electrothrix sp.]